MATPLQHAALPLASRLLACLDLDAVVACADVSPDQRRLLTVSAAGTQAARPVSVWALHDAFRPVAHLAPRRLAPLGHVSAARFTPCSRMLVTGSANGALILWTIEDEPAVMR